MHRILGPDFIDMLLDMGYSEEEITRIGGVHIMAEEMTAKR